MKCWAIGKSIDNGKNIDWFMRTPQSMFFTLVPKDKLDSLKQKIQAEQDGIHYLPINESYNACAVKQGNNICLLVCDQSLDQEQLAGIYYAIFNDNIRLKQLADNLLNYTKDPKIALIQNQLDDVKGIMKSNIDKLCARGEQLEHIKEKTEELNFQAVTYRHKAEELNSCWPEWSSWLGYCTIL